MYNTKYSYMLVKADHNQKKNLSRNFSKCCYVIKILHVYMLSMHEIKKNVLITSLLCSEFFPFVTLQYTFHA